MELSPAVVFVKQVIRNSHGNYCLPFTRNVWALSSSGGNYSYEIVNRTYDANQELFHPDYELYSRNYCTRAGWETQRSVDVKQWLINLRQFYPKGKGHILTTTCIHFRVFSIIPYCLFLDIDRRSSTARRELSKVRYVYVANKEFVPFRSESWPLTNTEIFK